MWGIYEIERDVHLIPEDDSEKHLFDERCPCEPRIELLNNGSTLYVHDSFDGRVAVEMANEILNKND